MCRNDGNRPIAVQNDLVWPRDLGGRGTQDFDGDGKADFRARTKSGWGVSVGTTITLTLDLARWSGSGFAFDTLSRPAPPCGRQGLDLSGDGFHDLVLGSPVSAGELAVIANDGVGSLPGEAKILLEHPNFEFLAIACEHDATEAGADGVYAVAFSSGTIAVFRTACDVTPPDCDGDGRQRQRGSGRLRLPGRRQSGWRGIGGGLSAVLFAWGMSGAKVRAADVNRDGSVDGEDRPAVLAAWGPCPPT